MAPDVLLEIAGYTGVAAAVAGGALPLSKAWRHRLMPPVADTMLKDTLPFDMIADDDVTTISKNGGLTRVIELKGLSQDSLTSDAVQGLYQQRLRWLNHVAQTGLSVKIVTLRHESVQALEARYEQPVLQHIHDRWMADFGRTWHNRHYVMLTEHPQALDWRSQLQYKLRGEDPPASAHHGRLQLACNQVLDDLRGYQPQYVYHQDEGTSDLLTFWSSLMAGKLTPRGGFRAHLSDQLNDCTVSFDPKSRLITWQHPTSTQVGSILTISRWGEQSSAHMMQQILALPGRITLLHHLKGWSELISSLSVRFCQPLSPAPKSKKNSQLPKL